MPKYAYERVADQIRERIYAGEWEPGTPLGPGARLPSRVALREHFGCSDQVIGWAMRLLRDQGLVETLHGVGVQVARDLPERGVTPE